jgi:F0F1-type ATP synthase alpha subunit
MKKVAGSIKLALAQYRELEAFSQFSSDLDAKTKEQLERGKRITEVLKQKNFNPVPVEHQVVRIFAVNSGIFDKVPVEKMGGLLGVMIDSVTRHDKTLLSEIKNGNWDESIVNRLTKAFEEFSKFHIAPLLVTKKTHVTQH